MAIQSDGNYYRYSYVGLHSIHLKYQTEPVEYYQHYSLPVKNHGRHRDYTISYLASSIWRRKWCFLFHRWCFSWSNAGRLLVAIPKEAHPSSYWPSCFGSLSINKKTLGVEWISGLGFCLVLFLSFNCLNNPFRYFIKSNSWCWFLWNQVVEVVISFVVVLEPVIKCCN